VALTGPRLVRLESVKWGGVPHRSWERLWQLAPGPEVVLWGPEGTRVREADGRVWTGPRAVLMHFWPDRDYNVVTLLDPEGPPRFYCNVCLPPRALGTRRRPGWRYVDLDLDVVVLPDGTSEVRDEREFQLNADRFGYPPAVRARALRGLAELQTLVRSRGGPFAPGAADAWLRSLGAPGSGAAGPSP
jgi:protein associated with RNAse G/E